jgi:ABC-type uncharacterized transport system auxiliary subunit
MRASLVFLLVAVAGCGVTVGPSDEIPRITYYHVTVEAPAPSGSKIDASVAVRSFSQDTALDREGIRYRLNDVEGGYFTNHRWAEPVASMLRSAVQKDLENSGAFERVLLLDDSGYADATVVGEVSRFGEEDRDGRWFAVVEVTIVPRRRVRRTRCRRWSAHSGARSRGCSRSFAGTWWRPSREVRDESS